MSDQPKDYILSKTHAEVYSKFRPTRPPQELIDTIIHYIQEKTPPPWQYAVDVGCGSGQGTLWLCEHFQKVLGLDPSPQQVDHAKMNAAKMQKNVTFDCAPAEVLTVEDNSVQLLTSSQAFHWFDAEKFYSEARRVLVPNGVLAIYSFIIPLPFTGDKELDQKLQDRVIKVYKGPEISKYRTDSKPVLLNEEKYQSVILPFNDFKRVSSIKNSMTMSIADYCGYVSTWSMFQKLVQMEGEEVATRLLKDFSKEMLEILQSTQSAEDTKLQFDLEYFMLLGRK